MEAVHPRRPTGSSVPPLTYPRYLFKNQSPRQKKRALQNVCSAASPWHSVQYAALNALCIVRLPLAFYCLPLALCASSWHSAASPWQSVQHTALNALCVWRTLGQCLWSVHITNSSRPLQGVLCCPLSVHAHMPHTLAAHNAVLGCFCAGQPAAASL